jgi:hypothetical protein
MSFTAIFPVDIFLDLWYYAYSTNKGVNDMSALGTHETQFTVNPSAATREWMARQLIAVTKLTAYTVTDKAANEYATPLFGQSMTILARVVPEAQHLSSYVNYGMAGIGLNRLLGDMKGKFRYRTSKTRIEQFPAGHDHEGHFYVSGMPFSVLAVHEPQLLPDVPINALVFSFDKTFKEWKVLVCQKMLNPRIKRPAKSKTWA